MNTVRAVVVAVAGVMTVSAFAGPKIEFDTKAFKCGEVVQGKVDKLDAVFIVKNTGNAALTMKSVRPSCGCTVVKYDTTIQPGKSAKIEASVHIKGYRPGNISKSVTVTSNAANDSVAHLTIEATIIAEIEVSEGNLMLGGDDTSSFRKITLSSRMKGLKVSEVFFRANENSGQKTPEWKKELPMPFKYTFTPSDSVRPNGYHTFTLTLSVPKFEEGENGNLIVKTNHPAQPEISIMTSIIRTAEK
jgi:hypothetical protein